LKQNCGVSLGASGVLDMMTLAAGLVGVARVSSARGGEGEGTVFQKLPARMSVNHGSRVPGASMSQT